MTFTYDENKKCYITDKYRIVEYPDMRECGVLISGNYCSYSLKDHISHGGHIRHNFIDKSPWREIVVEYTKNDNLKCGQCGNCETSHFFNHVFRVNFAVKETVVCSNECHVSCGGSCIVKHIRGKEIPNKISVMWS